VTPPGTGALSGVRVLEISENIAGPLAATLLGDMGADVIKVEPPGGESGRFVVQSTVDCRGFLAVNRNKRAIAIDLKAPEGRAVVHRLASTADVVIVNYRPSTAAALGIDYETLRPGNAAMIYLENSAVGRRGPDAHRPGYDLILQAMSGLMAGGGRADGGIPLPINPPVIDLTAGIVCAYAVCAALVARERGAGGQKVETTLLGTSLLLQGAQFLRVDGPPPDPDWTRPTYPYYRTYRTADGMVTIAAVTPIMRRRFEEAVGVVHPLHARRDIPRDSSEAEALTSRFLADVTEAMSRRTTSQWLDAFDQAGVPAGPYRMVEELVDDAQVRANDLAVDQVHPVLGPITTVGPIVRMSATPTTAWRSSPAVGQDNTAVLAEIGYTTEEIADLVRRKVLSPPPG
jgi:crotonobetainyl-CoA:carnitine CoA-transferase CaiB-like acyl-CoA transferase